MSETVDFARQLEAAGAAWLTPRLWLVGLLGLSLGLWVFRVLRVFGKGIPPSNGYCGTVYYTCFGYGLLQLVSPPTMCSFHHHVYPRAIFLHAEVLQPVFSHRFFNLKFDLCIFLPKTQLDVLFRNTLLLSICPQFNFNNCLVIELN